MPVSSGVFPAGSRPPRGIEINPEPTDLSWQTDLCVRQRAAPFFEQLMPHFDA